MLKTEYLVIASESYKATKDALKHHIIVDDRFTITEKGKKIVIHFNNLEINCEINLHITSEHEIHYYYIMFFHENINVISNFKEFLKAIKGRLYDIAKKPVQMLYDNTGLIYSENAYPLIHNVENLMRKLIFRLLFASYGDKWSEIIPEEITKTAKGDKSEPFLQRLDFIKLSQMLIVEPPSETSEIIKSLKKAKTIEDLNFSYIKSLIPLSIWDNHFAKIIDISREALTDGWQKLYQLRNKIAHNKYFTNDELIQVKELCEKFTGILEKSLEKINSDSVKLSEDEADDLVNNVNGNTTFIKSLFTNGHLNYGDKIYYNPYRDANGYIAVAIITREGVSRCLSIENELNGKFYSFSGLRKKIVRELDLKDINPFWGYNMWNEWSTEDGVPLSAYNTNIASI